MSSIFRIVGFAGCVREGSYNQAALNAAQDLLPSGVELEILDIADLPSFQLGSEQSESDSVYIFQAKIQAADAVVIMTPEYKGLLPNALKNALHWAETELAAKPVAIMGVGRRAEAERELQQLRQVLAGYNALVLEQPEVYITAGWEKFERDGSLTDAATAQQMRSLLEALVSWADEKAAVLVG
jgi:chromate reductase, NAD(P)H dehydrogenase (quinone)